MAQKYYTSEETATALGISEDEVKQMIQRNQLHGYRDGINWKFKAEEVDELIRQRSAETSGTDDASTDGGEADDGDVLLSEFESGPSASGISGTVIGGVQDPPKGGPSDSDLGLGDDFELSSIGPAEQPGSKFEELDLDVDDLKLEESDISLGEESNGGGSSAVDLGGDDLDDDDLVLGGGSGAGSDITIGGDSGISLVDPADSGLSLEEPLQMAGGSDASLELGEDDMISLRDDSAVASSSELKTDDDFLLTPLEEAGDDDDSESGSQVIALDLEPDAAPTEVSASSALGSGVGAMLDEDFAPAAASGIGSAVGFETPVDAAPLDGPALDVQPAGYGEGTRLAAPSATLPEAPYTGWNITALSFCTIFLILVGMMMFDMMRNMWSWEGTYSANSFLMDFILNLLP